MICSKCGNEAQKFKVNTSICLECEKKYQQAYYLKHKDKRKATARAWNYKVREAIQQYIMEYLSKHPCVDCGNTDVLVLEFDHFRDKKIDVSTLAARLRSTLSQVVSEISKCEVRCANCHRKKTMRQRGNWKLQFLARP